MESVMWEPGILTAIAQDSAAFGAPAAHGNRAPRGDACTPRPIRRRERRAA
jgi:hypothetical protein